MERTACSAHEVNAVRQPLRRRPLREQDQVLANHPTGTAPSWRARRRLAAANLCTLHSAAVLYGAAAAGGKHAPVC